MLSQTFGAATKWMDDYKTRRSGYGPPYFAEYGGDLPGDCNRMNADLRCALLDENITLGVFLAVFLQ